MHADIKEDNVMLSLQRKELVFIDFNCSIMVKQKIGERTLTKFKGTVTNCSPEMFEVFTTKEYGFVDLYYNDAHGLEMLMKLQESRRKELKSMFGEEKDKELRPGAIEIEREGCEEIPREVVRKYYHFHLRYLIMNGKKDEG